MHRGCLDEEDERLATRLGASAAVAVEARGLRKTFNGFAAVDGVDLKVARGSVHGLIGPNGAGKTTCFNLLTKFLRPSSGRIYLDGADITSAKPHEVARMGMVRSFQVSATFLGMTLLENVRIALQRPTRSEYEFWATGRRLRRLNERAHALLDEVGLGSVPHLKAADLSYGRKRALELATTLALEPSVLLLDEPTAGMSHDEIPAITDLIRRTAAGKTVVMVEHNLTVVSDLCDRITVLARGEVLAEGTYAEVAAHPSVIEAYMGAPVDA